MSLQKLLSRNSTVVVVVAVAAVGMWAWGFRSQSPAVKRDYKGPSPAFFTNDDGKSLFIDSKGKLTPFEKDGKPAVKAHLYRCPDGTEFVAYLERYTEQGKAAMERYRAELAADPSKPPRALGVLAAIGRAATEVKRPGDARWVSSATGAGERIVRELACSNGKLPEPIMPPADEEEQPQ